ncbi:hypothetical protein [Maridesulfovibrio sp.]|uniref:hypothetical protein n=1 Tax=Maridesulfovibrio sp. TaxID=2795000 RepID=UPI002A188E9C|nr:hypothetical protein [Maridesulfovibrio sp.]
MFPVFWWAVFTFAAIWAQKTVPGVDFMAPGVLLCLQLNKRTQLFWLIFFWSLIQDGIGGLPFGYSVAWYLSILALYRGGEMFFDVQSMMFALLCGGMLGVMHVALTATMSMLADMAFVPDRYIYEGVIQAVVFPVVWLLLKLVYPSGFKNEPV